MKVTIVPIVIGAFGTITKGLLKGFGDLEVAGQVETIQTTTLLRTARILRKIPETPAKDHQLTLMWITLIIIEKKDKYAGVTREFKKKLHY